MEKIIIKGEISRLARVDRETVNFSIKVSETFVKGTTFTIGSVVHCCVQGNSSKPLQTLEEPLKTAAHLAVNDKVSVIFEKDDKGLWQVVSIKQKPNQGQDINEFISCLEEIVEGRLLKAEQKKL